MMKTQEQLKKKFKELYDREYPDLVDTQDEKYFNEGREKIDLLITQLSAISDLHPENKLYERLYDLAVDIGGCLAVTEIQFEDKCLWGAYMLSLLKEEESKNWE